MKEVTLVLPNLHPIQEHIKQTACRFNVLDCGRRFGKDILGHELVLDPALDGFPVSWFAPTYRMMLDTFQEVAELVRPIATQINASEHRIGLVTGGIIDFWSLDAPDVARGRKYKRAIINEAAMVRGLENSWQKVIRPTLADYVGDAYFLSTPRGINYFKQIFDYGQSEDYTEWASWKYPTRANPFIQPSEIEAMQREMPQRMFDQEILAEFVEDGSYFTNVLACATATEQTSALEDHEYVIGVDWARSSGGDNSVFTVIDATTRSMAHITKLNGKPFDYQLAILKDLWERFGECPVIAEYNSLGMKPVEDLQAAGLPVTAFTTTASTKHEIMTSLALAFDKQEISILNDATLIGELLAFEIKERAGLPSYGAPDGMHDDYVMSLALAWWQGVGNVIRLLW